MEINKLKKNNIKNNNIIENIKNKKDKNNKCDKNNKNDKNILYKDIFDENTYVIELKLHDFNYKNKILTINNNYFNENKGLIMFYAPWCKHCKELSNLYIDLALANINLFYFGSVNIEDIEEGNDLLMNYANVSKYPTLKYINNDGTLSDYKFEYNKDNLIYYVATNI